MASPQGIALALRDDAIDATRALILQAYFALRRTRTGRAIGVREVREWIDVHAADTACPSDAVIQRALVAAGLTHRRPGKPHRDSQPGLRDRAAHGAPFLAVRTTAPRIRGPR
jgi:hypothetical protein